MLSLKEATNIIEAVYPDGKIQAVVQYKDLFVFQIFSDNPFEEELDPYFSVNRSTGKFQDFSIITDGDPKELSDLFLKQKLLEK